MAIIADDRYWLTCMRYVEMNPVRAGIVKSPASYRWSSYLAHAFGARDSLITSHALYEGLANTASGREAAWQRICHEPLGLEQVESLRASIAQGIVVGDPWGPVETDAGLNLQS